MLYAMVWKRLRLCASEGLADFVGFLTDYDLCEVCIASPAKRTQHNPNHVFFPMTTPYDRHDYDQARARAHPERIRHDGVRCDGCNSNPIAGIRHRCLDCEGAFSTHLASGSLA